LENHLNNVIGFFKESFGQSWFKDIPEDDNYVNTNHAIQNLKTRLSESKPVRKTDTRAKAGYSQPFLYQIEFQFRSDDDKDTRKEQLRRDIAQYVHKPVDDSCDVSFTVKHTDTATKQVNSCSTFTVSVSPLQSCLFEMVSMMERPDGFSQIVATDVDSASGTTLDLLFDFAFNMTNQQLLLKKLKSVSRERKSAVKLDDKSDAEESGSDSEDGDADDNDAEDVEEITSVYSLRSLALAEVCCLFPYIHV
jgi:hypothetical protein